MSSISCLYPGNDHEHSIARRRFFSRPASYEAGYYVSPASLEAGYHVSPASHEAGYYVSPASHEAGDYVSLAAVVRGGDGRT